MDSRSADDRPAEPDLTQMFQAILDGQSQINARLDALESLSEEDEAQVAAAKRRLAKDTGAVANAEEDADNSEEWEDAQLAGGVLAAFPKPSDAARALFAEDAEAVAANFPPNLGLSPEQVADSYAKAGPLWLAAYDRDYVMSLPAGLHARMVSQVRLYSQREADNLFRDLGKADAAGSAEWGMTRIAEAE